MNKRDYLEALNWYDSGLGQRITGIEESVSSSMVDIGVSVEEGNEALSAATSERKVLLARLIKTTKTNEFAVNSTINAALGVFRGVAGALPSGSAPKLQEFRAALEMQRPSLLQGFNEKSMALFALTYSKASDAELKQYEEFLASGAGSRWTKVMLDAMDSAYSQASQEFGKRIAMQMKPSTL
jgi:hypothetical protein